MSTLWIFLGALSGLISVAMGAFGAHALTNTLTEKAISVFHTAAHYQMVHALALLAVGIWSLQPIAQPYQSLTQASGWAFTIGSIVFSGSLYLLAITDIKILGAITPIGGLSFMIGWGCLAVSAWKAST